LPQAQRVVTVAAEAPGATYFVVEPNREQLRSIARLVDAGELRPPPVEIFQLASAREAFAHSLERGRRRKVVLDVAAGRPDGT
jgi:NADPH:quinone reductase-like Zn-dependent oxidoreductase